jgi:hypothetical protein
VKRPHQKSLLTPSGKPKPDEYLQGIQDKGKKGTYMGVCRRTACTRQPADWFNPNMANDLKGPNHAYYCQHCALLMNRENGHMQYWKLCYQGEQK